MTTHRAHKPRSGSETTKSAASAAASPKPPGAVPLPTSIEQLLYFNGRFLKAEDLATEAETMRLRVALSERAQGAGVSWGFHVTAASNPVSPAVVDLIATSMVSKMRADRTTWVNLLDDVGMPTADQIQHLSKTLQDICGAGPDHPGEASLTVGAGHAADGLGRDLYLTQQTTIKLSALLAAFQRYPTTCARPGPSITPAPSAGGEPGLTGAFLLTVCLIGHDHGQVPVYGVQCGDSEPTACSLGYHAEGVGLQLVFFDALADAASRPDEPMQWRGEGSRAYFEGETAAHPSQLPNMLGTLPFDGGAEAPDTGTHVPIGVVYLSNGSFVAYDEWTAKRLREPAEMDYWLRSLLAPARASQLARVLQFESQLTDALAASPPGGASLWDLGFAANQSTLVLPGVGFLPVSLPLPTTTIGDAELIGIDAAMSAFFAGVPYRLAPATPGEMDALFSAALASRELRLTKPIDGPEGLPAQVVVHYPEKDYQGYVMFTWPTADEPAPTASAEIHLLVEVQFKRLDDTGATVDMKFRDGELAGPPQWYIHPHSAAQPPDPFLNPSWHINKFSIQVLGNAGLPIQYSGFKLVRDIDGIDLHLVEVGPKQNGEPCESDGRGFAAFSVILPDSRAYSVRYMGRLMPVNFDADPLPPQSFEWSLDTVFVEDGTRCGVGEETTAWQPLRKDDVLPLEISVDHALLLQGLLVKVVPRIPTP